jgi:hypothetical protein
MSNWIGNLTRVILASEFYCASDDISTPETLVATAAAIMDRMAQHVARETGSTWAPAHVIARRARLARAEGVQRAAPPAPPAATTGGAAVTKPTPAPRGPRPGGIAVQVPVFDEIVF